MPTDHRRWRAVSVTIISLCIFALLVSEFKQLRTRSARSASVTAVALLAAIGKMAVVRVVDCMKVITLCHNADANEPSFISRSPISEHNLRTRGGGLYARVWVIHAWNMREQFYWARHTVAQVQTPMRWPQYLLDALLVRR